MTAPTPAVDTGEYRARVASLGWTLTSPGEVVSEGSREIGLTLVDGLFLADQLDTAIGKLAAVRRAWDEIVEAAAGVVDPDERMGMEAALVLLAPALGKDPAAVKGEVRARHEVWLQQPDGPSA